MKADEEKISALANLGTRGQPSADTLTGIEKLVCQVYVPNTVIENVKELYKMVAFPEEAGPV